MAKVHDIRCTSITECWRTSWMELITAVFVRASRGLMYIIPGDANIFCGRPETRHALVSAALRHEYVYLTSNTTASREFIRRRVEEKQDERSGVLRESHRTTHSLELAIEIGNSICVARLFEMGIVHVRWRDALFIADYPLKNYPLNRLNTAPTETPRLSRIHLPRGKGECRRDRVDAADPYTNKKIPPLHNLRFGYGGEVVIGDRSRNR